ncbi:MAG: hypothetical protein GVY36_16595 [Verrucomicrobia bacterium]|jgi:hypothetical protein|nr:hypothetical protein [Verrucomicrobiota bacterium]
MKRLDNAGLKGLPAKKRLTPAHRCDAVKKLMEGHQFTDATRAGWLGFRGRA